MRTAAVALVALAVTAIAGAPGAGAATRVSSKPALRPAFSAKVHDYASRCHKGRKLRLVVRPGRGTRVAVGRGKPRVGRRKLTRNLAAGRAATFKLVRRQKRSTYHVRCLPKDFPKWSAKRRGRPQARFYVVTPAEGAGAPYAVIFDNHGAPVWWKRLGYFPIDAKLLPNGNLAWSRFDGAPFAVRSAPYSEFRLDGTFVRRIQAVGVNTDFHDLQVMPNGHYLFLSYVPRDTPVDLSPYGGPQNATALDAVVQEVTRDGRVVWSWNSKDHVATSESEPRMATVVGLPATLPDGRTAYDLVHINSVARSGNSFVLSLAFTDALYKVSRATGAVRWKLGGTRRSESLRVAGEPEDSFVLGSQHDARVLADGTVTVHDNRTLSPFGPRLLRFRIDEAAGTARALESVTDPSVASSLCCGGTRRLPGGNWAVSWGYNPIVEELTPSGKVVFRLRFAKDVFSYRVVPVPAKKLSIRKLRAGMDAMAAR